jgi:hypothetical protein
MRAWDGRTDGRTDGGTNGRTDGRTDGRGHVLRSGDRCSDNSSGEGEDPNAVLESIRAQVCNVLRAASGAAGKFGARVVFDVVYKNADDIKKKELERLFLLPYHLKCRLTFGSVRKVWARHRPTAWWPLVIGWSL